MKQVVLREMRKDEIVILSVFVFLAFVAFKCFPLYELLSNWHAADTRLLNLLISLGITLLFLILTLMLVHRSRKKICITADSVTWYTAEKYSKPFPKTRSLRTVFSANGRKIYPAFLFSASPPSTRLQPLVRNTGIGASESTQRSSWKNWRKRRKVSGPCR